MSDGLLQHFLEVLGDLREQNLRHLAARNDFPPCVAEEIQQILENFQQERVSYSKKESEKTHGTL